MVEEKRPKMRDEVLKKIGDVEEVLREGEQHRKDEIFLENHQEDWRKKYPGRWVAVYREEFVAAVDDYVQLEKILKEKGIPPEKAVRRFLSTKIRPVILANI